MNEEQNLDYLSEDVQEILSTPPSWVMTWGTATIVMVLFLMGIVGYFFKYPAGRVELTTPLPPMPVIALESITIADFFVEEGQEVKLEEVIAIRDDLAKMEDVFTLERDVKQLLLEKEKLANYEEKTGLQLGGIMRDYLAFTNSHKKFTFEEKENYSERRMSELNSKKNSLKRTQRSLKERELVAQEDLESAEKALRLKQKEYSKADSTEQRYYENELIDAAQRVKDKKMEIASVQQEISESYSNQSGITMEEYNVQYETKSSEKQTLSSLIQSLQLLQSSIENWKTKNLIRAPISGKVTFFGQDLQNKVYQTNQEILSIIPKQEEEKYVGNIRLPILKTVKLKEGQEVRLKFDRFPFREWGYVVGKIGKMTPNQREEQYLIQVDLPSGLVTNKEKIIPFQYSMGGKAEVITADKRFITRMLDEFF
jgi:multidrug efflux pump subunit AcrA (membrane-fusion protein)